VAKDSAVSPQLEEIVREFELASIRLRDLHLGLGADAWDRRPAPESWSPSECVTHLNLSAIGMLPLLRQGLEEARRLRRPAGGRYRRDVVGWLVWRTISSPGRFKSKTIPAFVPSSDRPAEDIMSEFDRLQAEQIALTRAAEGLAIDRVKMVSPFNARVRYNIFSGLSILPRHQHRHLWQAEQAGR
jgi:DinB superfamily